MLFNFAIPTDPAIRLLFIASLIVTACAAVVLLAVLLNNLLGGGTVQHQRRSPVATWSMLLFAAGYYLLIRFHVGMIAFPVYNMQLALTIVGLLLVVGGTAVNILGRLALGHNWANQVTIYEEQSLVTTGVYTLVRHPLYASLIWMFTGGALIYLNWAALLANFILFIPMMIYRARLEEAALAERFPEYTEYQQRVGMLFPKMGSRSVPIER